MKKLNSYLMKAALALVAWVLSMPKQEAQAEFAITWAELKDEGWDLEATGVISLTAEVLNRNANETQRLNLAPQEYRNYLDAFPMEGLADQAEFAAQTFTDLTSVMKAASQSAKTLNRDVTRSDISDNPEDFI